MLSTQADSFRHKSRLAISLSWVAGYVNVVLLINCGQTVSHQTGNTTRFGDAIGSLLLHKEGAAFELAFFGSLIGLFLLGSFSSGLMIEVAQRSNRRSPFLFPMIGEVICLAAVLLLLVWRPMLPIIPGLAAMAMGLQNATITRISGAVVRTTHLTGVVTDLGLELVQLWRNKTARPAAGRRVILLSCIFGSFLFGVTAGTLLCEKFGPPALLLPVLFLTGLILQSFFRSSLRLQS